MSEVVVVSTTELQRLLRDTWDVARRETAEREVLSAEECAELLRIKSVRTILNYISERGLPAHKLGQEFRFFRTEVLAWLAKQPTKGAE
jgi:excisionase family DNA binding protein